jgi:hypothetical protein
MWVKRLDWQKKALCLGLEYNFSALWLGLEYNSNLSLEAMLLPRERIIFVAVLPSQCGDEYSTM